MPRTSSRRSYGLLLWLGLPIGVLCVAFGAVMGLAMVRGATDRTMPPPSFGHATMKIIRADGAQLPYSIEVAISDEEQEYGLMYRRLLAPNHGMLFIGPADDTKIMWMKNTLIPLDMLFVTADGTIVKIANAKPLDLTPISSGQAVRAVIEINGGEAASNGIRVGDHVEYQGLPPFN